MAEQEKHDYTPPDQEPEKNDASNEGAPPIGDKDVFEDGMIPVSEPEPPELIAARAAQEAGQTQVADGIASVTDTAILESLTKEGMTVEELKQVMIDAVRAQGAETAALRQQLAEVKKASDEGMVDKDASIGGYPWMIWRLPNKGAYKEGGRGNWVQVGPGGSTPKGARDAGSFSIYLRKGMTPMTKYGFIEPPTTSQAADSYLPMLKQGGAIEFPASQVIAYNWHKRPPMAGLKFPQYEALKGSIKNYVCEACGDEMAFMPDDKEIGTAYRTHLMTDHKYPFREAAQALKDQGFTTTPYAPATVEQMMERSSPE